LVTLVFPSRADEAKEIGGTLFISKGCMGCHGVSGRGGVGPALAHTALTFDAFIGQIRHPRNIMPAFPAQAVSDENAREIYRDPNADIAGNPNGDITVVEFFDYNCGYCKRGLHDIVKLVETDSKVRVVFKELPILSKGSEEASRVAIAAGKQGKYWEVHRAMLEAKGVMNEANALAIAGKLGLDIDKLKKDMASPEVEAEIKKSEALAKKMGVNGTPHFLVGDRAIPGAPEDLYEQLEKHVTELRKSGCSYC
jgi:protein-disulfide isomerase